MIDRPARRYAAPLALAALLAGCAGSVPTAVSTDPVALRAAADLVRQADAEAAARSARDSSAASAGSPAAAEAVGPGAPVATEGATSTTSAAASPTATTGTKAATSATAPAAPAPAASSPRSLAPAAVRIVDAAIPFGAARLAETAEYSRRHYGSDSSSLTPTMIVLHFTAGDTWTSARDVFAADVVNLGELPGTCAHYIVDRDGTVYSVVPVTIRCRHTIGLNDQAIGIEMVQPAGPSGTWADQQILARPAQVGAALTLVRQLQATYGIPADRVIGHAMADTDPHFHDLLGWRNDHVDWQPADVAEFRARL